MTTRRSAFEWTYEDWTTELERHFFRDSNAGKLVTFCSDGPTLAAIAGVEEPVAIESLKAAIVPLVMPGYEFALIAESAFDWETSELVGPPPSLPLLALTVLAASQMQRDEGVASHNYYSRFRELLDPTDSDRGMPGDFGATVPRLWRQLERWLNDYLEGAMGTLLLPNQDSLVHNAYLKNIAFGLQQAIFRESDKRHVYRFFRSIGVEPEEEDPEPTELRRALALWARRHLTSNSRVERLATDPLFQEYCLGLLQRLARDWDGRLLEESTGLPEGLIRIFLRSRPFSISLLAARDERMPLGALLDSATGPIAITADDADDKWFWPELPIEVNSTILAEGIDLKGADIAFHFDPRLIYALRFDDDSGGWMSVDRLSFGVLHYLLVQREARLAVTAFCAQECPGARLDPSVTPLLPIGWFLIRNFRLDRRPEAEPPEQLATLLRSGGGVRMRLVGGLKLPHFHHAYLTGGTPFLALPQGATERSFGLHKRGSDQILSFIATGSEFPLGALNLDEGFYEITHGLARIDFDLIEGIVETAGEGFGEIDTDGFDGLNVRSPCRPPMILPLGPDHASCIILGRSPNDIELVCKPKWISAVSGGELSWTAVDVWSDFEPVWCLTNIPGEPGSYSAIQLSDVLPNANTSGDAWSRLILESHLLKPLSSDPEGILWDAYRDAAKEIT